MKKILILFASFALASYSFAQQDSTYIKYAKLLEEQVTAKEQVIKSLNDSISKLNSKIKKLTETSSSVGDAIAEKDKTINDLKSNIEKQKNEYEEKIKLQDKFIESSMDLIYRSFLLYPLEVKLDDSLITAALKNIKKPEFKVKELHKTDYETYVPMLENYNKYNTEVINLFKQAIKMGNARKWDVISNAQGRSDLKARIAALEYNTYYVKRNVSPFQSILYIDKVLEDFEALLSNTSTPLSEASIQALIDKLQPKEVKEQQPEQPTQPTP